MGELTSTRPEDQCVTGCSVRRMVKGTVRNCFREAGFVQDSAKQMNDAVPSTLQLRSCGHRRRAMHHPRKDFWHTDNFIEMSEHLTDGAIVASEWHGKRQQATIVMTLENHPRKS